MLFQGHASQQKPSHCKASDYWYFTDEFISAMNEYDPEHECLMRMKSNFILKNNSNKNFRVNAILTYWLSPFPTPGHNLSWIAGGRGSFKAKAFNVGIQNVTCSVQMATGLLRLWMQDSQGSIRDMNETASPTAAPTTAEYSAAASCLPHCSGLELSSAFLLCKLFNNQHPWEWDAWHFLKTHSLNYNSTYEWKNLCLRLGDVGGVVLLLGYFQSFCISFGFW